MIINEQDDIVVDSTKASRLRKSSKFTAFKKKSMSSKKIKYNPMLETNNKIHFYFWKITHNRAMFRFCRIINDILLGSLLDVTVNNKIIIVLLYNVLLNR